MLENLKSRLGFNQAEKLAKQKQAAEQKVIIGEAVRRFLETEVGNYLNNKVKEDKQRIQLELTSVNPWEPEKVEQLQSEYKAVSRIRSYLAQAIIEGDAAFEALHQRGELDYSIDD